MPDEVGQIDAKEMLQRLLDANDIMLTSIIVCFEAANAENNQGLANFMAERQEAHKKHGWMLRSTLR